MKLPFRLFHICTILEGFDASNAPLDRFVNDYLRAHRAIGSKDRKEIGRIVYGVIRWKGLVDHLLQGKKGWEERARLFERLDPYSVIDAPAHIRCSAPKWAFDILAENYGEERAYELCQVGNTQAPVTVRVNTGKISRDELMAKWEHFPIAPCDRSPVGIRFKERVQLFCLPEFKEGLFEMQDEGSQLMADLVDVQPGQSVLDYCAGAGGKSLAIAPKMEGKGQLYLHDVRKGPLYEARRRLRRSGAQNVQFFTEGAPQMKALEGKIPWVVADVPCSGSGTWRRNPDIKWRFGLADLNQIRDIQNYIVDEVVKYLAPDGKLVYITCSLFPEENERQIEQFIKRHGFKLDGDPVRIWPEEGLTDGFFGARLVK